MWGRCILALAVAGCALGAPATASADDSDLEWRWPRFRTWEYVATGALAAEALTVRFALDWDEEPDWDSGILFDDWALDHLTPDTQDGYQDWELIGDVTYIGSAAWAFADPLLVGLTRSWDVAIQMALINAEAFAFYAAALWTTQYFVRRERPSSTALCESDPEQAARLDVLCDEDRGRSFIGGHVGVATTSAALTCLHHTKMDIYGDVPDALICGTWITAAGATFVARTVTAKHYLTDNILGVGLGLASGWLVPWALRYAHEAVGWPEEDDVAGRSPQGPEILGASVSPVDENGGVRLDLVGTL